MQTLGTSSPLRLNFLHWCLIQCASRETDVFEIDVTEQVEGVEAWVGGN